MKFISIALLSCAPMFAQVAKTPQLSTSDKIAIQAQEVRKQEAQKSYNDAQQNEAVIVQEWNAAHPGFIVNPQNFSVEPIPKKKEVVVAPKPNPEKKGDGGK